MSWCTIAATKVTWANVRFPSFVVHIHFSSFQYDETIVKERSPTFALACLITRKFGRLRGGGLCVTCLGKAAAGFAV